MKRPVIVATLMALALGATALQAEEEGAKLENGAEASIPFVNLGSSIRDWHADGTRGIWVQDAHRQWYYAKLTAPCLGLDFAVRVGFETRGPDTLDRFSTLVVPGEGRCAFQSFTKSEAPAGKRDKGEGADAS
jgi:hypothetical protein